MTEQIADTHSTDTHLFRILFAKQFLQYMRSANFEKIRPSFPICPNSFQTVDLELFFSSGII